jgi:hypothetical protein
MIVKLYHRLEKYASTPNRLNKLRVSLENRITPLELAALTADAGPRESREERKARRADPNQAPSQSMWTKKLNDFSEKSGKTAPEPFLRRRLQKKTWLISDGKDNPDKVLMLCFTGGARRMMMALPIFLQQLDASRVDVILFIDPDRDGFRGSFIDDENNLITQAAKYIDRKKYRGIVSMGTSGGGLPSVLVALGLRLDAVLSVCGNDPHDLRWITSSGDDGAALVTRLAEAAKDKFPDIYLLHSEDYDLDANAAKSLAELVSARIISYSNADYVAKHNRPIGHAVLLPALQAGTLTSLLNATIFSRFTPLKAGAQEEWSGFMSEPTAV